MDYTKVFGLPESVEAWIGALGLPVSICETLKASGYETLFACAYIEESDLREMSIAKLGFKRALLAGALELRNSLERVKAKVLQNESVEEAQSSHQASRSRTPICNSAIPRGVAPDYWDRARSRDRFQDRVKSPDGIHLMLVRHAQSVANVDMKYYTTHSDYSIPLSEQGIRQAAETGKSIASYYRAKYGLSENAPPPKDWACRIWTSPYVRTRQTSKLLLENASGWITDIQENVLLVEQNFGLFEGVDWYSGELDDKYPDELHHYQKAAAFGGRFWAKIPLGESRFDVCMRVSQCFGTIHRDVSRCNIRNFIIVSHGTSLRAFMMMWLRLLPEWFEEEPNPPNASVRVIDDYQDEGYIWPRQNNKEEREISNSLMMARNADSDKQRLAVSPATSSIHYNTHSSESHNASVADTNKQHFHFGNSSSTTQPSSSTHNKNYTSPWTPTDPIVIKPSAERATEKSSVPNGFHPLRTSSASPSSQNTSPPSHHAFAPDINLWGSFDRTDMLNPVDMPKMGLVGSADLPVPPPPHHQQIILPPFSPSRSGPLMIPSQYGGSEDILLRSSASSHPVNEAMSPKSPQK